MVRYWLRFDDLCPTMNHSKWARVEALIRKHDIKPLVSIIPDNRDPQLVLDNEDPDFWERMRALQRSQWAIGLHGWQHTYTCRGDSLVPIHEESEFVGLPEREQRKKIERGLSLLRQSGLEPRVWVAPGHSFDATTLAVLKSAGIECVCDGFSLYPYVEDGILWIPQQMWRVRRMPFGVWTICLHHNHMNDAQIAKLDSFLEANKDRFIGLTELKRIFFNRSKSVVDVLFRECCHLAFKNPMRKRSC